MDNTKPAYFCICVKCMEHVEITTTLERAKDDLRNLHGAPESTCDADLDLEFIVLKNDQEVTAWFNIYEEVGRAYGGPEEGGWYYPVDECVATVKVQAKFCADHWPLLTPFDAVIDTMKSYIGHNSFYRLELSDGFTVLASRRRPVYC